VHTVVGRELPRRSRELAEFIDLRGRVRSHVQAKAALDVMQQGFGGFAGVTGDDEAVVLHDDDIGG